MQSRMNITKTKIFRYSVYITLIIVTLYLVKSKLTTVGITRFYSQDLKYSKYLSDITTFGEYAQYNRELIEARRLDLNTPDREFIIEANSPKEYIPAGFGANNSTRKGVMLMHGLDDSPYQLRHIARLLQQRGFLVRTALLPGHGTIPGDMVQVHYQDWIKTADFVYKTMQQDCDEIFVGGYSTGGTLAVEQAIKHKDIKGLLLFTPCMQVKNRFIFFSKIFKQLYSFRFIANDVNKTAYESRTFNSVAQVYDLSNYVSSKLNKSNIKIPMLLVQSDLDHTVVKQKNHELFKLHGTDNSRLVWFGSNDDATLNLPTANKSLNVESIGHVGLITPANDTYRGINGLYRDCTHYKDRTREQECRNAKYISYFDNPPKNTNEVVARTYFNPYYTEITKELIQFLDNI